MTDKEGNALIPLPASGLENIGCGSKSILSGMVSDALALAKTRKKPLPKTVQHTVEEWMWINPFLTSEEAQSLVDKPPMKPTQPMSHEYKDDTE